MAANDGVYLQNVVEDALKKSKFKGQAYQRMLDSKAARRKVARQPADYLLSTVGGGPLWLECKTCGHKARRLTRDDFSQVFDMFKWHEAGVTGYILVHFYVTEELYLAHIAEFDTTKTSWKFGSEVGKLVEEESVEAALAVLGWKFK
jgi:hypothetical protein